MSSIKIELVSVTKAGTDIVVNAANSHLQAGGGVCGVIFREAGYAPLQKACDAIGYCETGSAAITPAFDIDARYIIHAVGPIYQGGNAGEERALYSCYKKAMELAWENRCHSIAFPLISSGIYGYPKREAWEVALRSVMDFQKANGDYVLDAVFCVISQDDKTLGESILDRIGKA